MIPPKQRLHHPKNECIILGFKSLKQGLNNVSEVQLWHKDIRMRGESLS